MVEISNSWNLVLLMFEFSKKYIHTYRNTYCVFNIYYNNNKNATSNPLTFIFVMIS